VCKLKPDGSALVFCSYVGGHTMNRDLAVDAAGDVYLVGIHEPTQPYYAPAEWFVNAFDPTPNRTDLILVKASADGSQVLWATYFGGSGRDGGGPGVEVGADGSVYAWFTTDSDDMPTTPGAYQRTRAGGKDFALARFTPDGSGLIFATYLGGSRNDGNENHAIALDAAGNAYVSGSTASADYPTTGGAFDRSYNGGSPYGVDIPVSIISADGTALLASTFLGGSADDTVQSLVLDERGTVYVFGGTSSSDFPVTADAVQGTFAGGSGDGGGDAIVAVLAPDLSALRYSTYFGGSGVDVGTAGVVRNGRMILGGSTYSNDWPVANALQPARAGGCDGVVAVLEPAEVPKSVSRYLPLLLR
jgi:hypothetical protein